MNFVEIIDKYKDAVFRIVYLHIGDYHISEDITQEVFIKIYRNLSKFRGDSGIYTWIYRIAINTIRTHTNKEKTMENTLSVDYIEDAPDDVWDEDKLIEGIQNSSVISLIQKLPDKYKEVLILYYYHDIRVEDISSIVNEPAGTIKSKLHRGRNMLKDMLIKEGVCSG
ncbi:MAG: sigma-70 family RNA polymerase sigma factor [Clostridiaceae bacterium]|nr:sigma-70 family RNA polymerase sigma factor [Clostridiaceae bacterium]